MRGIEGCIRLVPEEVQHVTLEGLGLTTCMAVQNLAFTARKIGEPIWAQRDRDLQV